MSASGPALFDDDLACDVRDVYRRMLEDRVSDEEATRKSIEQWAGLSPEEEPVFWLALAAAQSTCGRLDDQVRSRALEVIDSGTDVTRWREAGRGPADARATVLAELRQQLAGPQPARKAIRRPWAYVTDLEPGTVLAWTASNGSVALFRVVQILEDSFARTSMPAMERLAWTGREVPPSDVLAQLPPAEGWLDWDYDADRDRRPAACIAFKLKKRDPDWSDVGFTVCGHVPARPGDDGDWELHVMSTSWDGVVEALERRLTMFPSEQL
jgi:hypothetical protein